MSYCRRGYPDSDVYVISHVNGYFMCYCEPGFKTARRSEMIRHLLGHRDAGDKVPDSALERLEDEIGRDGDAWHPVTL